MYKYQFISYSKSECSSKCYIEHHIQTNSATEVRALNNGINHKPELFETLTGIIIYTKPHCHCKKSNLDCAKHEKEEDGLFLEI